MKKYLIILFLLLSPLFMKASFNFNQNCTDAFDLIISLRFNEARKLIANEKNVNPANAIPFFLDNYIDFLSSFISEEEATFDQYTAAMAVRKKRIERESSNSPYYKYCIATMDMQVAFTRMKFGEYIKAAAEINRAYRLLERNNREYPDFIPQKLSLGMLHTKSEDNQKFIESRLLTAYKRIRKNARNGLAVVPIERDACGGCFSKIPPQRQLDIRMHRKVIVCEYCGRILVDQAIVDAVNNN